MSIQALPRDTVRVIGASQVLTETPSIVKELIDNALDANATSVHVEVSLNLLDLVQVRDNGYGIAPEDRPLVCRRYCTSKIKQLSDLRCIGGASLGFRGEALASAAELCGNLVITTRVEGESIAVALKISRDGEVERQDCTSHPVGTTVRLNDLFSNIPVRRQTAMKSSAKSLARLKSILQAYAFARPAVRLSLRVLKMKTDKNNWTYAPKSGAAMEDAAFKIVGKECASQCLWSVTKLDGYEMKAFLPKLDAEPSKIAGIGTFVSVDGRPVATRTGTLKQIASKYRERLRTANPCLSDVKEPFAWINIICPPQSYDANIEPAKDDLLFEDGNKMLQVFASLLDQVYPQAGTTRPRAQSSLANLRRTTRRGNSISEDEDVDLERPAKRQRLAKDNMSAGGEDENTITYVREDSDPSGDSEHDVPAQNDVNVSNPWIIAKLNTSTRPRRQISDRIGRVLTPLHDRTRSEANSESAVERLDILTYPSPKTSPFGSPDRPYAPRNGHQLQSFEIQPDDSVSVVGSSQVSTRQQLNMEPDQGSKSRKWTGWQRPKSDLEPVAHLSLGSHRVVAAPVALSPRRYRAHHRERFNLRGDDDLDVDETEDEANTQGRRSDLVPRRNSSPWKGAVRRQQHVHDGDAFHPSHPKIPKLKQTTFTPFMPVVSRPQSGLLATSNEQAAVLGNNSRDASSLPQFGVCLPKLPREAMRACQQHFEADEGSMDEATAATDAVPAEHTLKLPLERVPEGAEVQQLLQALSISVAALNDVSGQLQDLRHRLFPHLRARHAGWEVWSEPATGVDDEDFSDANVTTFNHPPLGETEVQDWRDTIVEWLGGSEGWHCTDEDRENLCAGMQNALKEHEIVHEPAAVDVRKQLAR